MRIPSNFWLRVYKTFFGLNSAEHEVSYLHFIGPVYFAVILLVSSVCFSHNFSKKLLFSTLNFIIGIKHGFPCINVCPVPREMLKTEAVYRPRFSTSPRRTGQTLMYWKIMFDRCYCINSKKYLLNFGDNMALYFVTVWQSTRGSSFF